MGRGTSCLGNRGGSGRVNEGFYIDAQTIITIGAVVSALILLCTWLFKFYDKFKKVDETAKEVARVEKEAKEREKALEKRMQDEINELKSLHQKDQGGIQEELTLVVYSLLACLKGLQEQGCDGPVSVAVEKLEKHLNQKAHGQE